MRPFLTISALCLSIVSGCTCGGPDEPESPRPPHAETEGQEAHAALAYDLEEPAPPREAFAAVTGPEAIAALSDASRAGSWAGLRHGREERRSAGNFACRLETLYGRAPIVLPDRAAWVLRDEETGVVLTAVVDGSDPYFGAVVPRLAEGLDPNAQTAAANVTLGLARLLDATAPNDCGYTIDGVEVGVRDGEYR
ncbi:MAG: hypothetical protein J0L92_33120 [Deltaproteobacteria bacterium]|nr:hypothetical protein [Deltaproteobacteria bacterium]